MFPPLPGTHAIAALILTVVALVLFTRDRIPLESSSLFVVILLVLGFQIFPYQGGVALRPADFVAMFGHEALVTIIALMIVGKGLETTGALRPLGLYMSRAWTERPKLALLSTLLAAGVLSAFLNNTPIVVMLLPVLVGVSIRTRTPATGVLMPMGFATLIGGMATTIGTSTNLLVVGFATELGMPKLQMFDFTLPVLIAGGAGMLFLWLVAPRILPKREPLLSDTSPRIFNAMLHISEDSEIRGKSLSEVLAKTGNRMKVERIQRGDGLFLAKLPSVTIQAGDRLYVRDTPENLKDFESLLGAALHNVPDAGLPSGEDLPVAEADEKQQLAEVVVTRGSLLHHRTLANTNFGARFKLVPLAIHRARMHFTETTADLRIVRLRSGDVLLVQGTQQSLNELKGTGTMLVLDGTVDIPHTHRAPRAVAIMLLVVLAAAMRLLPISVSAVAGVGLMVLTNCLNWRDIAKAISAPVVLIIVASLSLGLALLRTGGADYLAQVFVVLTADLPIPFVLSGMILLMTILTNLVSNNAAAAIGTPIAFSIAQQLGANPEPFILAVLFGANMSYATPIGYQTNLLVMSAGGYKFTDFLRVGIPLTAIMWVAFSLLLPALYDL